MPFAIDHDKMYGNHEKGIAQIQSLDIARPPVKEIPIMEFPRVVYLHPKDKTQQHISKTVANEHELKAALKAGWRKEAHIPVAPEGSDLPPGFEPDVQ